MDLKKFIGNKIKVFRTSRGMNQDDLAERLDTTKQTVSRYEKGERQANQDVLFQLSNIFNIFNVSIDDFFPNNKERIQLSSSYNYYPVAISAGLPINVDGITNDDVEQISIPDNIMNNHAGSKDIFFIRANGESMNNVFPDGSLLAVKQVPLSSLHDDDIVVYSCNHEYAVKRFFHDKKNERFLFHPDSSDKSFVSKEVSYKDAKDLRVHGRVVMYIVNLD